MKQRKSPLKKFQAAYPIELYLSNATGYDGEQEFFSKFGLEIRNSVSVMMSKRSFEQRIPQNILTRPQEGDLIYIPFTGASGKGELYEVKFVQANKDMFMLGRKYPYFYELQLELFKYSQEIINTGVPEVDIIGDESQYNIPLTLGAGTGTYLYKEIVYQSPDGTLANATSQAIGATQGAYNVARNLPTGPAVATTAAAPTAQQIAGNPMLAAMAEAQTEAAVNRTMIQKLAMSKVMQAMGPVLNTAARVAGPAGLAYNAYEAGQMARDTQLGQRLAQGQGGAAQQAFRSMNVPYGAGFNQGITQQQAQNILASKSARDIQAFGGTDFLRKKALGL